VGASKTSSNFEDFWLIISIVIFASLSFLAFFDVLKIYNLTNNEISWFTESAVQAIASLFAIIFSISLVAIQLSSQEFSHRLIKLHLTNLHFIFSFSLNLVSLLLNLLIISNSNFFFLINYSIPLTIAAVLSLVSYIISTAKLLVPENVVKKYLDALKPEDFLSRNFADKQLYNTYLQPIEDIIKKSIKNLDYQTAINSITLIKKEMVDTFELLLQDLPPTTNDSSLQSINNSGEPFHHLLKEIAVAANKMDAIEITEFVIVSVISSFIQELPDARLMPVFEKLDLTVDHILNQAQARFSSKEYAVELAELEYNIADSRTSFSYVLARTRVKILNKAIKGFKNALKTITLQKFPITYSDIQTNLGTAYRYLADSENNTKKNYTYAISRFNEALKNYKLDVHPFKYSNTQFNLGVAYRCLAKIENREKNCARAIKAFKESLNIFTLEKYPIDYAWIQADHGPTYRLLAEIKNPEKNCLQAIKILKESLAIFTPEEHPLGYGLAKNNLANAYSTLAEATNSEENYELTIKNYKDALEGYTLQKYPNGYALVNYNLGFAYSICAKIKDKEKNIQLAIQSFENALKVYTAKDFPAHYKEISDELKEIMK